MSALRLPRIESYFSRCASVAVSVRSLTATMSMSSNGSAARMMLRPIRPNPLIPTLMAMLSDSSRLPRDAGPKGILSRSPRKPGLHQGNRVSNGIRSDGRRAPTRFLAGPGFPVSSSSCTCSTRWPSWSRPSLLSPWFLYQAIVYRKYVGSLRRADGPAARQLQPRRRRVHLDPRRVGGRGAVGPRPHRRAARTVPETDALPVDHDPHRRADRADPPSGRRRRLLPSRSTSRSSSTARCGLVRPRLFIMMETEIWPNLLRACRRQGVKTMLVNGRISARSYPRYRLARRFFRVGARRHRSLLHAERRVGPAHHRHRRRSGARGGHRQPEVRLARIAGRGRPAGAPAASCATSACRPRGPSSSRPARSRGRRRRCSRRSPPCAVGTRRRCSSWRRASPNGSRRPRRWREPKGYRVVRRTDLARRRRAARRRRGARHHRRTGASVSGRDRRVRRRQPGRPGRPQHSRAGRPRQADRVRAPHAELRRDCRRRSSAQQAGDSGAGPT